MKVTTAHKMTGLSPQFIREKCKDGTLGTTYGTGERRRACEVSPALLQNWMGWTREDFNKRYKEANDGEENQQDTERNDYAALEEAQSERDHHA